jgi:type I restriction enzyme S subunit
MNEWRQMRIGDYADTFAGGTPDRGDESLFGGSIPWIKSTEVNLGRIKETEEFLSEKGLQTSAAKWIPANSVLVAMYGATAAQVAYLEIEATANQAVLAICPREQLDSLFLYYALTSAKHRLLFLAQGSGQPNLNKQIVDRFEVPAPLPHQQRRIATILTTLDEVIEATEKLVEKHQQIKAGLMHDLFTRGLWTREELARGDHKGLPSEATAQEGQLRPSPEEAPGLYQDSPLGLIPKEWKVTSIEGLLDRIIDYRGKTPVKTESGVSLITAKNVRMGFIDPDPREFIAEAAYETWMTRGIPKSTDVLFTTEAPLGNVAQIGTTEKVAFAQRVIILQAASWVNPSFLKHLLISAKFQRSVFSLSSGTTALGVKQSEFRKVLVCHPTETGEQEAIANRINSMEDQEATQKLQLAKLRQQKQGLMHDLLTGRVRVDNS